MKHLLLRNAVDGSKKSRMMDIKIGEVTAVGGWQGKSRIRAIKNRMVDQATNSSVEGFRAEGFTSSPDGLEAILASDLHNHRLAMQKLPASELLSYWCSTSGASTECSSGHYTPLETSFLVVRSALASLVSLVSSASEMPVPQQWIGSSIGLSYDIASQPSLSSSPDQLRDIASVRIFDWGRSELTTPEQYRSLSSANKKSRKQYWNQWCDGTIRLAFETARFLRNQFCPASGVWRTLKFQIWSHNRNSTLSPIQGTVLGVASVDLSSIPFGEYFDLELTGRNTVFKTVGKTTNVIRNTLSLSFSAESAPTLLRVRVDIAKGDSQVFDTTYKVTVHSAQSLPKADVIGWCDPVVTIKMIDEKGASAMARTTVQRNTSSPTWNESFDFGIAQSSHVKSKELVHDTSILRDLPLIDGSIHNWDVLELSASHTKEQIMAFKKRFFRPTVRSIQVAPPEPPSSRTATLTSEVGTFLSGDDLTSYSPNSLSSTQRLTSPTARGRGSQMAPAPESPGFRKSNSFPTKYSWGKYPQVSTYPRSPYTPVGPQYSPRGFYHTYS
eukprot:TRINITY_DN2215_c0_g1_i2.p1 TRINITY_DN2215_c0_g1~~TRINITY_DN2215_c0_g1_i2.p1  ORF type:complete len:555 (+),score=65.61 TRINITY_DN2215_c0_g1_i2:505-2169(+)